MKEITAYGRSGSKLKQFEVLTLQMSEKQHRKPVVEIKQSQYPNLRKIEKCKFGFHQGPFAVALQWKSWLLAQAAQPFGRDLEAGC